MIAATTVRVFQCRTARAQGFHFGFAHVGLWQAFHGKQQRDFSLSGRSVPRGYFKSFADDYLSSCRNAATEIIRRVCSSHSKHFSAPCTSNNFTRLTPVNKCAYSLWQAASE